MIPDKLLGFEGYENGNNMIGVADVTLPEISYMTESIKGAGIAGEADMPAKGQIQPMAATINWRTLHVSNLHFAAPRTFMFDFRGTVQMYDEGTAELGEYGVSVVMKAIPKKFSLGKMDTATGMGTSGEYEVLYMKITIGGSEVMEIDKFNYIFKIEGVDYLETSRKNLGKN